MRGTGKVVRFDDIRGYGFIAPDSGADDIFLHANDIEFDRTLVKRGARVSFDIEDGPRGQFATSVQLAAATPTKVQGGSQGSAPDSDEYFDVFSADEFRHAVTEILLETAPSITAQQIQQVRAAFETLARKHGWLE